MENKELLGAGQEIKPPAVPTPAVRARALEDLLNPTINQGSSPVKITLEELHKFPLVTTLIVS